MDRAIERIGTMILKSQDEVKTLGNEELVAFVQRLQDELRYQHNACVSCENRYKSLSTKYNKLLEASRLVFEITDKIDEHGFPF